MYNPKRATWPPDVKLAANIAMSHQLSYFCPNDTGFPIRYTVSDVCKRETCTNRGNMPYKGEDTLKGGRYPKKGNIP